MISQPMNSSACNALAIHSFTKTIVFRHSPAMLALSGPAIPFSTHIKKEVQLIREAYSQSSFTYCHNHTSNTNIRAQTLSNPGRLPERTDKVIILVAVDYARENVVCVGRCADGEEDYEEEGLKVEEGCLDIALIDSVEEEDVMRRTIVAAADVEGEGAEGRRGAWDWVEGHLKLSETQASS